MTHTGSYENDIIVARTGKYVVQEMVLSWEKVNSLWKMIEQFRALFSDLTRGDAGNFMRFITEPNSIWLEICSGEQISGIVCFTNLHKKIDTDLHILFLDRVLTDKKDVCKAVIRWGFDNLPLQRMTIETPFYYYSTIRLAKEVGFKIEGEKRKAVLIGGRWANICQLGITRAEAI